MFSAFPNPSPVFEAETIALIGRMTSTPDAPRQGVINDLILALKTAGTLTKMDLLYVHAAHDQQAADINWANTSFTLSRVNSPTWTLDRGYTGDSATMELETAFTPNVHAVNLAQNSAHIGAFALTAGAGTSTFDFGAPAGTLLAVRARTGTGGGARVQDGGTLAGSSGGTVPVHILGVRRDATNRKVFRAGVEVNSANSASVGLSGNAISVLRAISSYTDRQVAICHLGSQLSDAEILATSNAFLAYLQAVGAA